MIGLTTTARRAPGLVAVVALWTLVGASCAAGRAKTNGSAPVLNSSAPQIYVAIGASDTRGIGTDEPLREAWPQALFRGLPANYRLVNLGIPDATVAEAVAEELPIAQPLRPALVTVWLNRNDVLSGVPASSYAADLTILLHGLRASGATVLVANTPPLDDLPAYLACIDPANHPGDCPTTDATSVPSRQEVVADVDRYNTAIATVVAQQGARLVDLHQAGLAARAAGTAASLVSPDGYNPNATGAQLIAGLFAAAFRSP